MASVFLGLDDPELTIPTSDQLARTSAALFNSKSLVLHTNIGDITATFDREHASETVIQVARFALSGALDETRLMGQKNGVAVTLSRGESRTARCSRSAPKAASRGGRERCRTASAGGLYPQPTIVIDTADSVPADKLCIGFARISKGIDLVAAFQPGTSATLAKAETISGTAVAKKVAAK